MWIRLFAPALLGTLPPALAGWTLAYWLMFPNLARLHFAWLLTGLLETLAALLR
jgi:hypothetical protein